MIPHHDRTPSLPTIPLQALIQVLFPLHLKRPPHHQPRYLIKCPRDIVIRIQPYTAECAEKTNEDGEEGDGEEGDRVEDCAKVEYYLGHPGGEGGGGGGR